jgi:hypothetical protein
MLDIFEPVRNPTAEFQINWPFTKPSPALQGSGRDIPAACQFYLVQMPYSHFALLRAGSRTREERGTSCGWSQGGLGEDGEE